MKRRSGFRVSRLKRLGIKNWELRATELDRINRITWILNPERETESLDQVN